MPGALDGVRVLELSEGWSAAALAGRLLADLGADVVKVEPPGGDPLRRDREGAFDLVAAGKRSFVLEGGKPAEGRSLETLLVWADLLVADSGASRLLVTQGVGVDELSRRWPHLVACVITPFGLRGPLRDCVGGEALVQAMSGVTACTGHGDGAPVHSGIRLGAHFAGLLATTAMLAALRSRDASGWGQLVDLSMHDCLVSCLGTFLPTYFLTGKAPARHGNRHTMGAPWNAFPCRDGWVIICALTDSQWTSLLRQIGRSDLDGDERYATLRARMARVDEVDAIVQAWTMARAVAEVLAATEAADIPVGPVLTVADLLASEHFRRRGMVVEVPSADGRLVTTMGSPFAMSLTPGRVERGAPALGEGTREVRRAAEQVRRAPPGTPAGEARPPLEGVRVLEMCAFTAGPAATRLLAGLGAEVIKIEPRRGEGARHLGQQIGGEGYLYHINNTDKRSVTLEITAPGARDLFFRLARASDAFVENFAPGTAEAWGIGPAALRAVNPRLVYCSISGFGHAGPFSSKRAFDTVIQAMAGVMTLVGDRGGPPLKIGISVADLAGSYLSTAALLAALHHRDRSGRGQHVDVSMHDATGWLTAATWPAVLAGREARDHTRDEGEWERVRADGRVLSVPEVAEHPHTVAREMVVTREHPSLGPLRLLGIPLGLTRPASRVRRPAPTLGADNTEVYGSLAGQTRERLAELHAAGVV